MRPLVPCWKAASCCGKRHKHYVYNTESLEGVCVRHDDYCTAVARPQPSDSPVPHPSVPPGVRAAAL
jgi:hypothetical protein